MMHKKTILLAALSFIFLSCNKTNGHEAICNGESPTYNTTIEPILTANCAACHGANSGDGTYNSYASLQSILSSGKFEKEVMTKQSMPTQGPLSDSDLDLLRCWLDNGYPEN